MFQVTGVTASNPRKTARRKGVATTALGVTFSIISATGGTDLPFSFGHVFKEGDVPTGSYVDADLTDWQAIPTSFWPDGSWRHAIIAGRATCTANVAKVITFTLGAPRLGTLSHTLPSCSVQAGNETITLANSTLHREVCAGPVMVQRLYRASVPNAAHLTVYFEVRFFKGGAVEIHPWVENAFLFGPTFVADTRTWTVTVGSTQVFSMSLTSKVHTRISLIDNRPAGYKHWSYWAGISDPQIEPVHNTDYMMLSKMVPNYGWTTSETTLAAMASEANRDYWPMRVGNVDPNMPTPGHSGYVGKLPPWAAKYVASNGDVRAYRSVLMNGLAAGSWPTHARDGSTLEPLKFSTYPDIWANHSNSAKRPPALPGAGGTPPTAYGGSYTYTNGTYTYNPSATSNPLRPDVSHVPTLAYLPWLLTGRWFYMDEQLMWITFGYNTMSYVTRELANCVQVSISTPRSRARFLRLVAQCLAVLPSSHTCFPDLLNVWEKNMLAYNERLITGTRDTGRFINNLGITGHYSSQGVEAGGIDGSPPGSGYVESAYFPGRTGGYWWEPAWMHCDFILTLAIAKDYKLPQSTASAGYLDAVLHFGYKLPVGLFGTGQPGTFHYRLIPYAFPCGTDQWSPSSPYTMPPEEYLEDFGAVYAVVLQYGGPDTGINVHVPVTPPQNDTQIWYYDGTVFSTSDLQANSGFIYAFALLAQAVDHGAVGALDAWNRVMATSTMTNLASSAYTNNPTWGWYPRSLQ